MDLDLLLKTARQIAKEAGVVLLQGRPSAMSSMSTKRSLMDIVTDTDRSAEHLIIERIREAFPNDAIIGEEGGWFEGSTGRRWIIDPLDGTANYIRGWLTTAVSIGIEIDGVFSIGVVFNPFLDEMFTAVIDAGAYLNGEQLLLPINDRDWGNAYVGIDGGFDAHVREERSEIVRRVVLESGNAKILGSTALSLCYLAAGRLDAFSNTGSSIWDIAAGIVIAREAGSLVEGLEPGSEPTAERLLAARPEFLTPLRALVEAAVAEVDGKFV